MLGEKYKYSIFVVFYSMTKWSLCYHIDKRLISSVTDCITVLSPDQCEYFANHGAVQILFDILKGSNKSLGVDRCIELCLLIILNLYRSPKTAAIVWKVRVIPLVLLFHNLKYIYTYTILSLIRCSFIY